MFLGMLKSLLGRLLLLLRARQSLLGLLAFVLQPSQPGLLQRRQGTAQLHARPRLVAQLPVSAAVSEPEARPRARTQPSRRG